MTHDQATTIGAAGAVIAPWWLPHLHSVSEVTALIASVLGIIWLGIQIYCKLEERWRRLDR